MAGNGGRKVDELIAWRLVWAIMSGTGLRPPLVIKKG